ncbi:MAG TPA: Fe-S cluster assembly protein SufD [Ohtaekwangia sp.]|uniref:Fe-S cluster assembly protein SufD n=1 Tax=Ohtaekwangia sp. TaxID=2066019 RepID=UPI002F9589A7
MMSVAATEKNITTEVASEIEKSLAGAAGQMLKKEALDSFRTLGFPANKAEEYKFTPITRALERNFNLSLKNPVSGKLDIASYKIQGLDAHVLVFINGVFSKEASSIQAGNFTILSLQEALLTGNSIVEKHLGNYADFKADALVAWNTASFSDGVFIHVPDKIVADKPVILYHIHDAQEGQVISLNRNLIVVGKSSELTVMEKFDSKGTSANFSNAVTEAVVSENAGLELYSIQNDPGARYQFGLTQIHQSNFSRVNTYTFTLNGKLIRNNLQFTLDGEGIESHMYGLYLLANDTLADNHTVVDHKKPNSFSNELYKGIMGDSSKGVFNGKIYVRPNAQKTNAFQANRNILLTDKATVNTKPQLEIWADDVKCSHGCTTGQLDEEALFYLQARGIAKDTAQAMMLYAFAGEVLDNVKNPVIKEYLDNVISERLHKDF